MSTITKRSTKSLAARGLAALAKAPTGIKHLDEVTGGGLPRGAGFLADVRRLLAARPVVARHCWLWPGSAGDRVSGSRYHQVRLKQGLLQFRCVRPILLGLEALFAAMQKLVCDFDPAVVVLDSISDLIGVGTACDVLAMLTRQVDFPWAWA